MNEGTMTDAEFKLCVKCLKEKNISLFRIRSDNGKRRNECSDCLNLFSLIYKIKHKEIIKIKNKQYKQSEIGKLSVIANNNRRKYLLKQNNDFSINKYRLQTMLYIQYNKCNYCGCILINKHLDHIIPISKGGMHSINNVQWLCNKCNLSKGNNII